MSAAAAAESYDSSRQSTSFPAVTAAQPSAPAAVAMQNGSRVRIVGLQAKSQVNGRFGVVCGPFDQESGRWMVDVAAEGERPAFRGSFRAINLRLIPSHNFSTEWVDENGCVWPKDVDFSRQCAKGHALAALAQRCRLVGLRLMCRLCHCFCRRDCDEAASWLICSVDAGCCGEYAVCCSCASRSIASVTSCAGSDEISTLVSRRVDACQCAHSELQGVAVPYLSWLRSTLGASLGSMTTSQFCQLYVRPYTWFMRGSVTERLRALGDTAHHVGEASWFISHTWNNSFVDTLDAVLLFFEGREDGASSKVWLDIMVTSQHLSAGPSKPPSWISIFKSTISHIGGLLLVVDAWDNPTALQRAW
jgi:hypothetical protein